MIKKFAGIILLLALVFSSSLAYTDEQENYCLDKESWKEWEDLARKYPNDENVQALHALRVGLCLKIKQGSITFEMARDIFNRAQEMVIQKAKSERERKGPKL
jgi:hypothetical protein